MSDFPDGFFIGYPGPLDPCPERPIGQGDVFEQIPVAVNTSIRNEQAASKAALRTVIVIDSACGMRKAGGNLNPTVCVAVVHRMQSIAPGWGPPWPGRLNVMPLPGLHIEGEPAAANIAQLGPCGSDTLDLNKRLGCATLKGLGSLKARIATYFARHPVPDELFRVGAFKEWHELDLWQRWAAKIGEQDGFQPWLDEPNPNYPASSRRDSIYDDLVGLQLQIEDL